MIRETKNTASVSLEGIGQSIIVIRGQRVILDRDLAAIYEVSTGRLNQAVNRNIERFPQDFMFKLTRIEAESSRSQFAILKGGRGYNMKYLPNAYTEHGAIQAANVLSSRRAVIMGVHVVRAFVQLRNLLNSNKELARKFAELERKLATHDQAITGILKAIHRLMAEPKSASKRRSIGFVELEEKPS